jgi:hypothetical protein
MKKYWQDPSIVAHSNLLIRSYRRLLNKNLITFSDNKLENSFQLFHSPFILVSHGIEKDPIFNYANETALKTWEMPWEEFVGLPSRFSVEKTETDDREKLLSEAQEKGFVSNYLGIRITKSGKSFKIIDTILYNLTDEVGNYKGQAAIIPKWEFI